MVGWKVVTGDCEGEISTMLRYKYNQITSATVQSIGPHIYYPSIGYYGGSYSVLG